jgi:putative NADPH-quinone reductase
LDQSQIGSEDGTVKINKLIGRNAAIAYTTGMPSAKAGSRRDNEFTGLMDSEMKRI